MFKHRSSWGKTGRSWRSPRLWGSPSASMVCRSCCVPCHGAMGNFSLDATGKITRKTHGKTHGKWEKHRKLGKPWFGTSTKKKHLRMEVFSPVESGMNELNSWLLAECCHKISGNLFKAPLVTAGVCCWSAGAVLAYWKAIEKAMELDGTGGCRGTAEMATWCRLSNVLPPKKLVYDPHEV